MKLTEKKYKELSKPHLKGRKNTKDAYHGFLEYIDIKNIKNEISKNDFENFDKYFLDFADLEFGNETGIRFNFLPQTKLDLLKRSGGYCAICGCLTIFPFDGDNNGTLTIAAACHIHPASPNGPRADIEYRTANPEKISMITNGLWACVTCHYVIDKDVDKYTVEYLTQIKNKHEITIKKLLINKLDIRKVIDNFETINDSRYIQIKKDDYEKHDDLKKTLDDLKDDHIKLFRDFKDVEKESIKNAPLFTTLKSFMDKKKEEFGDGDLGLHMTRDRLDLYIDIEQDNRSIEEVEKHYGDKLSKTFIYDKTYTKVVEHVKKNILVQSVINNQKDLEFFLVNKTDDRIIAVKDLGFNIKNHDENSLTLYLKGLDVEGIIEIQMVNINKNENWFRIEDTGLFLTLFSFILYLDDFELHTSSLMVRYKNKIYPIDFSKIVKYNNGKYEIIKSEII